MINLETLEEWLLAPTETERLEFKQATQQYDSTKLLKYCVALANEGGGYIVLYQNTKKRQQMI
jgi:ATP-dependent DNA helicase RecG